MRIRGYLIVLGLCGLGLLTPTVARAANCREGQPSKFNLIILGQMFKVKVLCKGLWTTGASYSFPGGGDVEIRFDATEDNSGKECHAQMHTLTGAADEIQAQQGTCTFTKDQQVKFSIKKK